MPQLRSPQPNAGAPFVPRTATVRAAHKSPWNICLDLCGSALDLPQYDQWALLDHRMGAQCHLTQNILSTSCLQFQALSPQGIQKYWARALPWFCSVGRQASVETVCEVRVVMQQCVYVPLQWWRHVCISIVAQPGPPPCPPPTSQGLFHHELHDDGLDPQEPLRGQISHSSVVRVLFLERAGGHRYPDQAFLGPLSITSTPLQYPMGEALPP